MALFDIATLGVVISIVGWGISRIEGVRTDNTKLQMQISHNKSEIDILKADVSAKLDILIFRLRVLEERIKGDYPA
jgi:hypothetical protein